MSALRIPLLWNERYGTDWATKNAFWKPKAPCENAFKFAACRKYKKVLVQIEKCIYDIFLYKACGIIQ
jgi:hypothetical protein